jgi:hypothetical protein
MGHLPASLVATMAQQADNTADGIPTQLGADRDRRCPMTSGGGLHHVRAHGADVESFPPRVSSHDRKLLSDAADRIDAELNR